MKTIRCGVIACLLCLPTRAAKPPSDFLRLDAGKSGHFEGTNEYHINCFFTGTGMRAFAFYTKSSNGMWNVVGYCLQSQGNYPEVLIDARTLGKPPVTIWVGGWQRNQVGHWVQVEPVGAEQAEDELGNPYRSWWLTKGQSGETAQVNIYRKAIWDNRLSLSSRPKLEASAWPAGTANKPKFAVLGVLSDRYALPALSDASAWIGNSGDKAVEALRAYGPSFWDVKKGSSENGGLSRKSLLDWISTSAVRAKVAGAQFLVTYYAGHGGALGHSEEWLFLGQFEPTLLNAIRGAADLDEAVTAPPDYVLSLGDLYSALEATGLPFVLLVDACFPHSAFENQKEIMNAMRIPASESDEAGDVIGLVTGVQESMFYIARIQQYGNEKFRYLSQKNPVVLAASPGNAAIPLRLAPGDPDSRKVGPLAYSLVTRRTLEVGERTSASLPTLIRSLATDWINDKTHPNHMIPASTLTWSNFGDFARFAYELKPRREGFF